VACEQIFRYNTVLASHKDRVLSAEQVKRLLEYGRNVILFTESAWPRRVERHLSLENGIEAVQIESKEMHFICRILSHISYLFVSQIFPVQSMEQVARKSPQECQEQPQTAWIWSVNVRMHSALVKSQIFTVVSPDTVAKWPPLHKVSTSLRQYVQLVQCSQVLQSKKYIRDCM
jgi:hypothetical protein